MLRMDQPGFCIRLLINLILEIYQPIVLRYNGFPLTGRHYPSAPSKALSLRRPSHCFAPPLGWTHLFCGNSRSEFEIL